MKKKLKYRSRSYEYNLVMELSISLDSKLITNNAVLWFKMINLVFLVKAKYFYKNIIEAYSIMSTNICLCAYTDVLMSVVMFLFFLLQLQTVIFLYIILLNNIQCTSVDVTAFMLYLYVYLYKHAECYLIFLKIITMCNGTSIWCPQRKYILYIPEVLSTRHL